MGWRVVAAASAGTSHLARGTPCEDRCLASVSAVGGDLSVLCLLVADGAGSAPFAAEGADLALQSAADRLAAHRGAAPDEALAHAVLDAMRTRIAAAAAARETTPRAFACTFLGLVSSNDTTLVMQIGDGGVVLDTGAGLQLAIEPMAGEYANSTRFVIDEDAAQRLAVRVYAGPLLRAAAFSDGLQRLALDLASGRPHGPLFARLFDVTASASPGSDDELHAALLRFLDSPEVNARTDDDKSLAVAVRSAD
jgi:hypothetical protein